MQIEDLNFKRARIKLQIAENELRDLRSKVKTANLEFAKRHLSEAYNLAAQYSSVFIAGHHKLGEVVLFMEKILMICEQNNFKIRRQNKQGFYKNDVLVID